jgi:hypothetical protein
MAAEATSSGAHGSRYWVAGFPELVEQWDRDRNGGLSPEDLPAGSARRVWWACPQGPDHRWRAKPNNRTYGAGCPFCKNRRVSVTNSLATLFPDIAAEWHPEENGTITPRDVVATSTRVVWWRCARDPRHVFRAVVRERTRILSACPFCANHRACESNNLARIHPRVAAEWHPALNGELTPHEVLAGSRRRVVWCCARCSHSWRASVLNRVSHGSGCPRCARRHTSPQRKIET